MSSTRWLRACGERPYRCFLWAWLLFALISVALGFFGLSQRSFPHEPPRPGTIPYAQFAPGGARSEEGVLNLSPDALPPSTGAPDPRYWFRVVDSADGAGPRLHTGCIWRMSFYGWPSWSVFWGTRLTWDVTDPSAPASLVPGVPRGGLIVHASEMGVMWTSEHGPTGHNVNIELPGALLHLALPQMLALLTVVAIGGFWRARRWRRRRRGACLECGHDLDPARPAAVCPECGSEPRAERTALRSPGRLVAALFILLGAIWLVVQVTISRDFPRDPVADRLDALTRAADEYQRAFTRRVTLAARSRGWPLEVFFIQEDQWFAVAPGQPPRPGVPRDVPGLTVDRQAIVGIHHHADPSFSTTWRISWPLALLELASLQILATILVGLIGALTRWHARVRE